MKHKILLASQSPRRKEILRNLGIPFSVRQSWFDEDLCLERSEDPVELVEALARGKAAGAAEDVRPGELVLGADTVVVFEGRILGKPRDRAEALEFLGRLSGREHLVVTGIALLDPVGGREFVSHGVTKVRMRPFAREEMEGYIGTGEPLDKAGAYGIQGYGAVLVEGIEGDYFNVVGLPVGKLLEGLREMGVDYFAWLGEKGMGSGH
ncbi:Maf family protein [Anaerotalea alkaliphila]|uniref:dTTP/UTP pyrophosphatase n=1 Tax=Anaerotalea alkaliphila TaxID=2662126 RepID=A0A7X5KP98_9FIRM|nr:nucleoside triphosphate pyrophosphatase [Anaerotalea alkaliphila]NDL67757.1 septum formation protein Maf [Anaerotalea alkaliphila]